MGNESSSGEEISSATFWRKLRGMVAIAGRKTLFSSLVLFNCLKDRDTPAWARGVIVGALGYLILPTDLIPDMLPGAGYGDDWSTIVVALGTVAAYIKETHKLRAKEQLDKLFGGRNSAAPSDFVE
ncbi:MAG: YkvA family protein [Verrucomicrobiota bacterium]